MNVSCEKMKIFQQIELSEKEDECKQRIRENKLAPLGFSFDTFGYNQLRGELQLFCGPMALRRFRPHSFRQKNAPVPIGIPFPFLHTRRLKRAAARRGGRFFACYRKGNKKCRLQTSAPTRIKKQTTQKNAPKNLIDRKTYRLSSDSIAPSKRSTRLGLWRRPSGSSAP